MRKHTYSIVAAGVLAQIGLVSMTHASPVVNTNWSGIAISPNTANPAPLTAVSASWTVPVAHMPIGVCDSGPAMFDEVIGLDGAFVLQSLQAGVQSVVDCEGDTTTSSYTAFFAFSNSGAPLALPVTAGDVVSFTVWYDSPTHGNVWATNETTGQIAQASLNAPKGSAPLVGSSAEWIIATRQVQDNAQGGSHTAPIANYVSSVMTSAVAANTVNGAMRIHPAGDSALDTTTFQLDTLSSAATIGATVVEFQASQCERNISDCNAMR